MLTRTTRLVIACWLFSTAGAAALVFAFGTRAVLSASEDEAVIDHIYSLIGISLFSAIVLIGVGLIVMRSGDDAGA